MIKTKLLTYKEYKGSIEFDEPTGDYYGQILEIDSYVDYVGAKSINELEIYFKEAVESHISRKTKS